MYNVGYVFLLVLSQGTLEKGMPRNVNVTLKRTLRTRPFRPYYQKAPVAGFAVTHTAIFVVACVEIIFDTATGRRCVRMLSWYNLKYLHTQ